jgi:3-polyprenyl-4-hydroxybenzoate decarboxylase
VEASIVSGLASLGAAGAVIIALFYYMQHETTRDKLRIENDQKVLDRIDKIVDRHLAAEEANRRQIGELSEANHSLFDRVIGLIMELSNSIKELTASNKAHEKAILELRAELRSLVGPPAHKAIGHEEPRPFGPG